MTIPQDQTAELFRALGRIEQSIIDMSATLERERTAGLAVAKRVGSLERSRTWQKAWMAGAIACGTTAVSVLIALYKLVSNKHG